MMDDRIPTEHDMDIVDALDLMQQHYMDQTDTDDQAAADFERDEAITIKRAMNEITRLRALRAQLERARDQLWQAQEGLEYLSDPAKYDKTVTNYAQSVLSMVRELDHRGGDGE